MNLHGLSDLLNFKMYERAPTAKMYTGLLWTLKLHRALVDDESRQKLNVS